MADVFTIEVTDSTTGLGTLYDTFTDVNVYKSIESALGDFRFTASNVGKSLDGVQKSFPFNKGDECIIRINDQKLITGYVNEVSGAYSAENFSMSVYGRDKTQDLVDCAINGNLDLKSPVSLKSIIEKVLSLNNINDILVIENDATSQFSKSEIVGIANKGETAFEVIERCCRKKQVLFTTNEDGDIVLTRASSSQYPVMLKNETGANDNNIVEASFSDADSERYNLYLVYTQGNLFSGIADLGLKSKKGQAVDSNIRSTRILEINSNISSDIQTNRNRAIWESNIRRARGFQYNCRVRGYFLHPLLDTILSPNKVITVKDDMFGINADLLIKSCNYVKSSSGSYTDLELVNKNSYTLQAEQDRIEEIFNQKNGVMSFMGF